MVSAAAGRGDDAIEPSDATTIKASFDREWSHFDYGDLTWSQTVEERRQIFLREVRARDTDLRGSVVLDAGCGNGSLSRALNDFGCEVVAADVSASVVAAHHHFAALGNDRTHFIQADLMNPPFRGGAFDIVYSCGVLHHTPSTRRALDALVPSLAPGGTVYIWLYWKLPGLRHRVNQGLRALIAPLPPVVKHNAVRLLLVVVLLMRVIRRRSGRTRPQDDLSARELLVLLLDHHTPRYRWEHTPEEVHRWYGDLGLTDAQTTEEREWGFGVAARRPGLSD
jgi:SAM-dependent methyltransferase